MGHELAAEGWYPLEVLGQTNRTCPVSALSPPGWPRRFSSPGQTPSAPALVLTRPSSWECWRSRRLEPAMARSHGSRCPVPGCWLQSQDVAVQELRAALGETWGTSLSSCKKMGTTCHSPSDCHSLIISGQRGWRYSLSLSYSAGAVVAIVAEGWSGAPDPQVHRGIRRDADLVGAQG